MAELPALPDLVRSAADVTDPPAFDNIVRRAHVRRRRQMLGASAFAVVAVVAVLLGTSLAGHNDARQPVDRPSPPVPSPTQTLAEQVIAVADVSDYAIDDGGDLLTVWSTCLNGTPNLETCHFAWKLVTRHETFTGLLPNDSDPRVASANGGFAVLGSHGLADLVLGDGSTQRLGRDTSLVPYPGEAVVVADGRAFLVDGRTARWSPLQPSTGTPLANGVFAGETAWGEVATRSGVFLAWRLDAGPWHTRQIAGRETTWGSVVVAGSHVVATAADVVSDYNPLAVWSASSDSGQTWTDVTASHFPFGDVAELAATPGGTLYVASLKDGLFRSTDQTWTHFVKVPGLDTVSDLKPVSDGVAMLTWQRGKPRRGLKLDDAGRVRDWPTPLS